MNESKIRELMQGKDYDKMEVFLYWCKLKGYSNSKIKNAETLFEYSKEYLEGNK